MAVNLLSCKSRLQKALDKRFNKWHRNCTGIFTSGNFSLERVVFDLIVEVTLDLFPKVPFGKIAFDGFARF